MQKALSILIRSIPKYPPPQRGCWEEVYVSPYSMPVSLFDEPVEACNFLSGSSVPHQHCTLTAIIHCLEKRHLIRPWLKVRDQNFIFQLTSPMVNPKRLENGEPLVPQFFCDFSHKLKWLLERRSLEWLNLHELNLLTIEPCECDNCCAHTYSLSSSCYTRGI